MMYKKVIDLPNCVLNVQSNSNLDSVLGYGSRLNKKRSFLFKNQFLVFRTEIELRRLRSWLVSLKFLIIILFLDYFIGKHIKY